MSFMDLRVGDTVKFSHRIGIRRTGYSRGRARVVEDFATVTETVTHVFDSFVLVEHAPYGATTVDATNFISQVIP